MGIDCIERKIRCGRHLHNFRACDFQLAAECFMLGLRCGEVRRMVKAQLLPAGGAVWLVPAGGAGRTDEDAFQSAGHGMSVETRSGGCLEHFCLCRATFLNRLRLVGIYMGIMAKATWEGAVLAESDATVEVEGNQYFPPDAIRKEYFKPSDAHTVCPWKGTASYYDVEVKGKRNAGAAWFYPEPKAAAKQITGYVAFWKGVKIEK